MRRDDGKVELNMIDGCKFVGPLRGSAHIKVTLLYDPKTRSVEAEVYEEREEKFICSVSSTWDHLMHMTREH